MEKPVRLWQFAAILLALFFILGSHTLVAQAPYCTPQYSFNCQFGDQINNFSTSGGMTNIVNNNSACSSNGYFYDSIQAITMVPGESFDISVQASSFSQGFVIWIDWNNNFDYSDVGELVWSSPTWSNSPFTGTIQIPAGQIAGTFRMRVRCSYNSLPTDPCASQTYGEVEEYRVVVEQSAPKMGICYGGIPPIISEVDTASGESGPFAYLWQASSDEVNWSSAPGTNTAFDYSPTATLFDTTYYRRREIDQPTGDTVFSAAATVYVPDSLYLSASSTNASCNGVDDGAIDLSVIGGASPFSFSWSNGDTVEDLTGMAPGSYSVTVTDKYGCTDTSTFVLTETNPIQLSLTVDSTISCNGLSDGGLTAAGSGGAAPYTYLWSNTATTASITGNAATYSVILTDNNGCQATDSTELLEPTSLAVSIVIDSNASCNGFINGGATASATGGTAPYTYLWSNSATNASITGVAAGTYSVTVTDANGCTATNSNSVAEPVALVAVAVVDSNASCNGFANGGLTAGGTGGTAPYTYSWSNSAATASITGMAAGSYSVTITDANGCTAQSTELITEPAVLSVVAVVDSNASCNGFPDGGTTVSATGGTLPYTYLWSNSASTASITGIASGSYSVTITDANGCVGNTSVQISEPASLVSVAVVDSNANCFGFANGGGTATASGGTAPYTYSWSNAATTASITGANSGSYSVTITDANGCSDQVSLQITEPTQLAALVVVDSNASCNGFIDGGATASATGGTAPYTYLWSNSAANTSITGVAAGTYSVTVTDANGCTATDSSSVAEPVALVGVAVVDSNASCNGFANGGLTTGGTGGTAPYTYSWSNSASTASITGVAAGSYTATITDDNGCTDEVSEEITEPEVLAVVAVVDSQVSCHGFSNAGITANTSGGTLPYSYGWSNGATTGSVTGISAGIYSVSVTDNQGCIADRTVMLLAPRQLTVSAVVDSDVSCYGFANGSMTSTVRGGTIPYTYRWSNNGRTPSISGLVAGTYSLSLTDANGCIEQASTTISQPDSLSATARMEKDASCFDSVDGEVSATAGGGTAPYEFSWSNGGNAANNDSLAAGTYSVIVSDYLGCQDTAFTTVAQPAEIFSGLTIKSNVECSDSNEGALLSLASGGVGPYTYLWSNGARTIDLSDLERGEYILTITDSTGCTMTDTARIEVLDEEGPIVRTRPVEVSLDRNGQVMLTPDDVDAGSTDNCGIASMVVEPSLLDCSNIGESLVTLTITDNSGNTASSTALVSIQEIPTAVSLDGFTLSAELGKARFQWLDCNNGKTPIEGAIEQTFTPLEGGTYAVEITVNSCADTSECIEVFGVGVDKSTFREQLNLYPNPTSGDFFIDLGERMQTVVVTISTVEGKILSEKHYENVHEVQSSITGPEGFYFVKIMSKNNQQAVFTVTKK